MTNKPQGKDTTEQPKAEPISADPESQSPEGGAATTAGEGTAREGAVQPIPNEDRTGARADTAAQRDPSKNEYKSDQRGIPHSEALQADEDASAAAVKNPGNRVSLGNIKDHIANVAYMTGHAFAEFANGGQDLPQTIAPSLQATTVALVTLQNGFSAVGLSCPVDPQNFDAELGKKFAYEDAVRKLWPVLGYAKKLELAAR